MASALIVTWARAARGIPPVGGLEALDGERPLWVGPGIGPMGSNGDLEGCDVLVIGDSRAGHAVHLSIASRLGIGEVALLWGFGVSTEDLLTAVDEIDRPRTLVMALSPLGLVGLENSVLAKTLRERHPAFDPENPPHVVRAWARAEVEWLVASGTSRTAAESTIDWWSATHRRSRALHQRRLRAFDTKRIDLALGHHVDRWRSLALSPLEPAVWQHAWIALAVDVTPKSERSVSPEVDAARRRGAARIESSVEALLRRGWRVAAIRLPTSPRMRRSEDLDGGGDLLRAITEALRIPYLEFEAWEGCSNDGSHLHWRSADRLTRELARWLREDLGWGH